MFILWKERWVLIWGRCIHTHGSSWLVPSGGGVLMRIGPDTAGHCTSNWWPSGGVPHIITDPYPTDLVASNFQNAYFPYKIPVVVCTVQLMIGADMAGHCTSNWWPSGGVPHIITDTESNGSGHIELSKRLLPLQDPSSGVLLMIGPDTAPGHCRRDYLI